METHVKVLAVLYIVLGAIGVCTAFIVLIAFGFAGGATAISGDADAIMALPIIGLTGTAVFVFLLLISLPGVVAGIGLLKFRPWARILAIVIAALNLINFPVGTVLAIYAFWVLLSQDGARLFTNQPPPLVA